MLKKVVDKIGRLPILICLFIAVFVVSITVNLCVPEAGDLGSHPSVRHWVIYIVADLLEGLANTVCATAIVFEYRERSRRRQAP